MAGLPDPVVQDWAGVQRNFDALADSLAAKTARASLTWPGGTQYSNALTVTHNMGSAPSGVLVSNPAVLGVLNGFAYAFNLTATTFQIQAWSVNTPSAGAAANVQWLACP